MQKLWDCEQMLENRDPEIAAKKSWLNAALGKSTSESTHNLLGPPERVASLTVDLQRRQKALGV